MRCISNVLIININSIFKIFKWLPNVCQNATNAFVYRLFVAAKRLPESDTK